MLKIGIILGSTRPGRNTEAVAQWVYKIASRHESNHETAEYELIDIKNYNLPLLDEPVPPAMAHGKYSHEHTRIWSEKIKSLDGFIFVTPEYNHATSAAMKNAIDYLYEEWNNKAACFVSFGSALGARAVENLRLVMGELQIADIRLQVSLSLHTDFENFSVFKPSSHHEAVVGKMLDQLLPWTQAMKTLRDDPHMSLGKSAASEHTKSMI